MLPVFVYVPPPMKILPSAKRVAVCALTALTGATNCHAGSTKTSSPSALTRSSIVSPRAVNRASTGIPRMS